MNCTFFEFKIIFLIKKHVKDLKPKNLVTLNYEKIKRVQNYYRSMVTFPPRRFMASLEDAFNFFPCFLPFCPGAIKFTGGWPLAARAAAIARETAPDGDLPPPPPFWWRPPPNGSADFAELPVVSWRRRTTNRRPTTAHVNTSTQGTRMARTTRACWAIEPLSTGTQTNEGNEWKFFLIF